MGIILGIVEGYLLKTIYHNIILKIDEFLKFFIRAHSKEMNCLDWSILLFMLHFLWTFKPLHDSPYMKRQKRNFELSKAAAGGIHYTYIN